MTNIKELVVNALENATEEDKLYIMDLLAKGLAMLENNSEDSIFNSFIYTTYTGYKVNKIDFVLDGFKSVFFNPVTSTFYISNDKEQFFLDISGIDVEIDIDINDMSEERIEEIQDIAKKFMVDYEKDILDIVSNVTEELDLEIDNSIEERHKPMEETKPRIDPKYDDIAKNY